jgi:hypothetical protein
MAKRFQPGGLDGTVNKPSTGIPDMQYINRKLPIVEVAEALGLTVCSNGNLRCWHPERHEHEDRTASVGIWKPHNRVKCFGCGTRPLGPIDLVMDVRGWTDPGTAAKWIAAQFDVPYIPKGRHIVAPNRDRWMAGHESEIELLIRSGLWAKLSPAARQLVPVLLEFSLKDEGPGQTRSLHMSYQAMLRYSGLCSPNAISRAVGELTKLGWMERLASDGPRTGPVRKVNTYRLTPHSDAVREAANAVWVQTSAEIETERQLRKEKRKLAAADVELTK